MNKKKKRITDSRFVRVILARKSVVFCIIILLVTLLISIFADQVAPYGYDDQDYTSILQGASSKHLLGTDVLGRDILSRLIYGGRVSFSVGALTVIMASVIGIALGLVAGVAGGTISAVIMRTIDAISAVPTTIMSLFVTAILGRGIVNMCIAIAITLVPSYCRITRSQVLSIRNADYVVAGTLAGNNRTLNTIKHILPNTISLNIVMITMNIGAAIMCESTLSFLGMGVNPPMPSWGSMVNDGYTYLERLPLMAIIPGVYIMIVVLCFNIVGDAVRDALDPKLKGTLADARTKKRNRMKAEAASAAAAAGAEE